jgi:hypothetical protein
MRNAAVGKRTLLKVRLLRLLPTQRQEAFLAAGRVGTTFSASKCLSTTAESAWPCPAVILPDLTIYQRDVSSILDAVGLMADEHGPVLRSAAQERLGLPFI